MEMITPSPLTCGPLRPGAAASADTGPCAGSWGGEGGQLKNETTMVESVLVNFQLVPLKDHKNNLQTALYSRGQHQVSIATLCMCSTSGRLQKLFNDFNLTVGVGGGGL